MAAGIKTGLLFLLMIFAQTGYCIDAGQGSETFDFKSSSSDIPEEKSDLVSTVVDKPHKLISNNIESISRFVDNFFSDETIYNESTGSYVRVRSDSLWSKGGKVDFNTSVRTKIELPKTKKKLQLLIRNEEEEDQTPASTSLGKAVSNDDYSTALRRILSTSELLNVHTDAGVKLRSKLDPFVRFRVRSTYKLGPAQVKFIESVSWFDSEGWQSSTILQYNSRLYRQSMIRISSQLITGNRLDSASWFQSITLYNAEHHNKFFFELSASLSDKPNVQDKAYAISAVYKETIYSNWAFITMGPKLSFNRDQGFRTEPAFFLQLEANFGELYGH